MQGPNTTQWAKIIEEKQDQLCKNGIWTLILASKIKPDRQALGQKWIYKVKHNIDGNINRFKARWVVKSCLQ